MATIIGTDNDDDTTFLQSLFTGHGKALIGTDQDDHMYGLRGDDLLFAGDGNDYLDGGEGADVMEGGNGNDVYIVDNVNDETQEDGATGYDEVVTFVSFTLADGIEKLTLAATAGAIDGTGNALDNDIIGNDFANVLDGRAGDDDISGKDGDDTLFGGAGDDHLSGGRDNDILAGGLDNDTLDGGQGADQMFGADGDDVYFVDNSGDVVSEFLGSGYDAVFSTVTFTLPSGVEALVLEGDLAIDGTGNALNNTISGNERSNTLRGLDGDDVMVGGGGDDTLFGGRDNDTLYGNENNDTLNGGSGDDDMIGGTGNDTYVVDSLADVVEELANEGIDTVQVNDLVNSTLAANVENLTLLTGTNGTGNNLANVITGNLLDNILDGRGGSDTLIGGQGHDTASYASNSGRVIVTLGANGADGSAVEFATATGTTPVSADTLRAIENVHGSAFGDQITGNQDDNVLDGGGGLDVMQGGGGNDTYIVDNLADIVVEGVGQGIDTVRTGVSYALNGTEVEVLETTNQSGTTAINLTGNNFANTINGNNGANLINGAGGVDTMRGFGGNDTYIVDNSADVVTEAIGQGAADRVQTSTTYSLNPGSEVEILETTNAAATTALDLVGNEFNNTINGNNGHNALVGGLGQDIMTGFGDTDTFVFTSTADSSSNGNLADIVTDFQPHQDFLVVSPIDADVTVAGDQAFSFIGTNSFSLPGQIAFFTTATDTFIVFNTDANLSTVEMAIHLNGVHAVDAGFFVL